MASDDDHSLCHNSASSTQKIDDSIQAKYDSARQEEIKCHHYYMSIVQQYAEAEDLVKRLKEELLSATTIPHDREISKLYHAKLDCQKLASRVALWKQRLGRCAETTRIEKAKVLEAQWELSDIFHHRLPRELADEIVGYNYQIHQDRSIPQGATPVMETPAFTRPTLRRSMNAPSQLIEMVAQRTDGIAELRNELFGPNSDGERR